jgi:hypothetical protein
VYVTESCNLAEFPLQKLRTIVQIIVAFITISPTYCEALSLLSMTASTHNLHSGPRDFTSTISRLTTSVLVLHPIACLLTFSAFILSILLLLRIRSAQASTGKSAPFSSNGMTLLTLLTLIASTLSAIITTAVVAVDVALVIVIGNQLSDNIDVASGMAGGMVLGVAVALWLVVGLSAWSIVQMRQNGRSEDVVLVSDVSGLPPSELFSVKYGSLKE